MGTLLFENQPNHGGVFTKPQDPNTLAQAGTVRFAKTSCIRSKRSSLPTWHRFPPPKERWLGSPQHGVFPLKFWRCRNWTSSIIFWRFHGNCFSRCMLTGNDDGPSGYFLYPKSAVLITTRYYKTSWRTNNKVPVYIYIYICSFHSYFYQPRNFVGHVCVETNLSTRKLTYHIP